MNLAVIAVDVALMLVATVVLMLLLGALSRRLLGVRMSAGRIILAGVLGLAAGVGFESQFELACHRVHAGDDPGPVRDHRPGRDHSPRCRGTLIPQGTLPRPDQWAHLIGAAFDRNTRCPCRLLHRRTTDCSRSGWGPAAPLRPPTAERRPRH